ncbi:MAG: tRNA (N6-threonylcarbamoyladenosine(37)-N6)-methyltransferase TrmO, partial [Lachnospiraceae bacterium]|nr:tRNA (N6-threonylcarbamoyladenosine(37)-N6)-methyltransferase TrmO [Lachnospiraceae bacterium]
MKRLSKKELTMEIKPIAHIQTSFHEKFGIPRQSGLTGPLPGIIVFEPEFRDESALRGIEEFSHLWLIWHFSANKNAEYSPTVRPPRLGGNVRMGVFATRSPFRPNGLGLSSVRLVGVENRKDLGTVLIVEGADLLDGTPIFDIKPYLPYADLHPDAVGGFTDTVEFHQLEVSCPDALANKLSDTERQGLFQVLAQDPRPSYQKDS